MPLPLRSEPPPTSHPFREAGSDFATALRLLRESAEFRAGLSATLAAAPFAAFRWECPPVTLRTLARPFDYALSDAPELCVPADPAPFRAALSAAPGGLVAMFANLSGDALLIVPRPLGPAAAYASLAHFVRGAPPEQVDALWQSVGAAMAETLNESPIWLSTAGAGVAWLHVRLDRTPKYYVHAAYRAWPQVGDEVPPEAATLAGGAPQP